MFGDDNSLPAKLPLDQLTAATVQRLGRWMRVVGTIQLAFTGMTLLFLVLSVGCNFAAAASIGAGAAMLFTLIPIAVVGAFLLQALRTQEAGEQFKNLADEHDLDYLELAFVRLKTVYIIDIVAGVLLVIGQLGGGS